MKQLLLLNPEQISEEEAKSYPVREAARAIVIDEDGKIALLYVSTARYFKLPGGGIEEGENRIVALKRECQEEIACNIDVVAEIGSIVEYRKFFRLTQISYCYITKLKGKKGKPEFTKEEKEEGFQDRWMSYDDARRALVENAAMTLEGRAYIVPRDMMFLEKAKKYVAI